MASEEPAAPHDDAPPPPAAGTVNRSAALSLATPQPEGPTGLWGKIKRHKVVEWTLAYIAFGYALLHGIEMLRDAFEWPAIVSRLTVIALLAGIPIAVTLAWFHGHRAQHRVTRSELSILILLLIVGGTVL